MTVREAILSHFDFDVPDRLVDKVLIDRLMTGDKIYTVTEKQNTDLCVADICGRVLLLDSVTEGGMSIKFDKGVLKNLRKEILLKYDLEDEIGSTISSRKVW